MHCLLSERSRSDRDGFTNSVNAYAQGLLSYFMQDVPICQGTPLFEKIFWLFWEAFIYKLYQ